MNGWHIIRTIAKRELSGYFDSPVAYVFLVIFLLLAGVFTFTFGGFFDRGEAALFSFFNWMPWLFLFFFANFPAGLVMYWVWSNSLSILQQAVISRRHGKPAPLSSGAISTK